MDGLAEILSYVFNAQPFTTTELALTIDSLRLWNDTLTQAGIAPDFVIAARKQELLSQLLRHQNADGGFSVLRGGNSTMGDTAEALTALGPLTTDQNKFPKTQAIGWIKQHLANTWLDEKERAPRAAAYAALAAADAIDPASLHYFSDTSATDVLPPIAEAHIAAAFKHIRDPNAAAFWIRKMLDENNQAKTVPLLDALAATDALSSDDVHAAMKDMTEALRHGNAPTIKSAAELLRALAADNADAGKIRLSIGNDIKEVSGVLALVTSNPTSTSYHSADSRPLSVTLVSPVAHAPSQLPPQASIARHIYRINGVELLPPAKPAHGEIYMVELKGTLPTISENQQVLIQDGSAAALRPLGCPLTAKLDTLSFIPWFTTHDLSPLSACEYTSHEMNAVVAPTENDSSDFSVVYFARIDALATTDIQPPRLRIIE
jgi:DNA-binding phage protein